MGCVKKKSRREKRTIYLLPTVRTYAPWGQTPTLHVKLTRDHLSTMGGIAPEERIFMQTQGHTYKGPDVVRFLQVLLREIRGQLLVIWDGAPIHRCQAIKDFLAQGGAKRIHLERLPAYAPELNPQEGVWKQLNRIELKNVCCLDVQHVQREVHCAKERLRHRKSVLRQCFSTLATLFSFLSSDQ
jgi:transposase